jgi:8-oxo-dGTP diphosphatase
MPNTVPESAGITRRYEPIKGSVPIVHVAVAVIERISDTGEREVLIAKRPQHVHQGGLWEFPGGKVEQGETVTKALSRELHEELGIVFSPLSHAEPMNDSLRPLIFIEHDYGDKCVSLDVWLVSCFDGRPEGKEGQPIQWVSVNRLDEFDFPLANLPIINACRLPSSYVITPEYSSKDSAVKEVLFLREKNDQMVLFRQPQWRAADYLACVDDIVFLAPALKKKLVLSGQPGLAAICDGHIDVLGVQLPFDVASSLTDRPFGPEYLLGVSCHGLSEIKHAQHIGADYITLSPVSQTESHPDQSALGWDAFAELATEAVIPVYALGGMSKTDLQRAYINGAQGIAGIRLWID